MKLNFKKKVKSKVNLKFEDKKVKSKSTKKSKVNSKVENKKVKSKTKFEDKKVNEEINEEIKLTVFRIQDYINKNFNKRYLIDSFKSLCGRYISVNYIKEALEKSDIIILLEKQFSMELEPLGFVFIHDHEINNGIRNKRIFYVSLICSRIGHGKRLMKEVIRLGKENDVRYVQLSSVLQAIGFYHKLGFLLGEPPFRKKLSPKMEELYEEYVSDRYVRNLSVEEISETKYQPLLNEFIRKGFFKHKQNSNMDYYLNGFTMTYCFN